MFLVQKTVVFGNTRHKIYKIKTQDCTGYTIYPVYQVSSISGFKKLDQDKVILSLWKYSEIYASIVKHKETMFYIWDEKQLEDFLHRFMVDNFVECL